jgi:glycosyltransferase involved in cell wall biosynthesis
MPYLARAAVVALPSWWEGSSNVLLEALACKTPVVASETAGNARVVLADGRYGMLVDPTDVDGIAAALLRQSGEFAIRPGTRALAFSSDRALDAYSIAFADLVTP